MGDEDDKPDNQPSQPPRTVSPETMRGVKREIEDDLKDLKEFAFQADRDSRDRDGELHKKIDRLIEKLREMVGENDKGVRDLVEKLREAFTTGLAKEDRRIDGLERENASLTTLTTEQSKAIEALVEAVQTAQTTLTAQGTEQTRLDTLTTEMGKAVAILQDSDPMKGAKFWQRPAYIGAVLGAIATGVTAIVIAVKAMAPEKPTKEKATTEKVDTKSESKPD